MINLLPLTKLFIISALLYFMLVSLISFGLTFAGIESYSKLRIAFMISAVFEFFLLYLFTIGWRKIWKYIPILNSLIFPDLNGKWNANIYWNWKEDKGTKEGTVFIKQSLIKISVDLVTDKQDSSTLVVKPFKDLASDQAGFYYMYHSESKENSEDNHKGAAVLKLHLDDVNKLSGNYFTDRNTSGRYEFIRTEV